MDRAKNPFSPGAGTPPPALVGRQNVLEDAVVALERVKNGLSEKSMLLVGLRGVGKTVLLGEIQQLSEDKGYFTVFIEAHESRQKKTLMELLLPHIRRVLLKLDQGEALSEKAKKALRVFKSILKTTKLKIGEIEMSIEPEIGEGDSGDLELDLTSLLIALGEAAKERKTSVAIIIDEIQYLDEVELSALIMGFHRISQRSLPVLLIGAGLPQLVGKAGNSKSYAERLFAFPIIGPLPKEEAFKALQVPTDRLNVTFERTALEEIYKHTKGYPYFIQEWGYHAWNIAPQEVITKEDIDTATLRALESLDESFFRVRFERLTPSERKYVKALAQFGPDPQRSGDIASKLGKSVESVAPVRSQLIHKGMIYSPAHGDTAFTVPLFEDFVLRELNRLGPLFQSS